MNAPTFIREKRIVVLGTRPVTLPRNFVQDIDIVEDRDIAELMVKVLLPDAGEK